MQKLMALAVTLLICSCGFASSTGFNKGSTQIQSLGSSFKSQPQKHTKLNQNDITMGYAGTDISRRPTLDPQIATL